MFGPIRYLFDGHGNQKASLQEKQSLPIGRAEFHEWSDRIIKAAAIPGATEASQKFALARMILDLKPTVAFESDAFFAHCLRKGCANQVADKLMVEIRNAEKSRLAAEETKKAEDTASGAVIEKMADHPI